MNTVVISFSLVLILFFEIYFHFQKKLNFNHFSFSIIFLSIIFLIFIFLIFFIIFLFFQKFHFLSSNFFSIMDFQFLLIFLELNILYTSVLLLCLQSPPESALVSQWNFNYRNNLPSSSAASFSSSSSSSRPPPGLSSSPPGS